MATPAGVWERPRGEQRESASAPTPETGLLGVLRVAACLDGSELGERVIPHALGIAGALGAPLTLLRVLECAPTGELPPDPLQWDIRRREARGYLERLARERCGENEILEAELIEGQAAEQICLWAGKHQVDLTVLSTHGMGGRTDWSLSSTARKLVDRVPGSLLLVPTAAPAPGRVARYRRLLVPLDGSHRAESVLPLAAQLAAAHRAELLIAHVVPVPELTEIGPLEAEDLELRERLARRNERVANEYLDRLRARLAASDRPVRALVLRGGDVRSRLARLIADEAVDLVVLSAHGRSGRSDVPCGDVAAFLVGNIAIPLLMVRPRPSRRHHRVATASHPEGIRLPSQAAP